MATVLNKEKNMIKVFTTNKSGKIELTEKELKQLLDDVYWEGYRDNNHTWTYTTPLRYPYYSSTTSGTIYCNTANNATISNANTSGSTYTIDASSFNGASEANIKSNTISVGKGSLFDGD